MFTKPNCKEFIKLYFKMGQITATSCDLLICLSNFIGVLMTYH